MENNLRRERSAVPDEFDTLIAMYHEHKIIGVGFIAPMTEEKRPANCVGCRSCEQVCPQRIKISGRMADYSKMIGL